MALFLVRHQHSGETCPTRDPNMGRMLLQHISEANASQVGINIDSFVKTPRQAGARQG